MGGWICWEHLLPSYPLHHHDFNCMMQDVLKGLELRFPSMFVPHITSWKHVVHGNIMTPDLCTATYMYIACSHLAIVIMGHMRVTESYDECFRHTSPRENCNLYLCIPQFTHDSVTINSNWPYRVISPSVGNTRLKKNSILWHYKGTLAKITPQGLL